jgi:hypothetical protein
MKPGNGLNGMMEAIYLTM